MCALPFYASVHCKDEYDDTYDTANVRIKEPTQGDDFEE